MNEIPQLQLDFVFQVNYTEIYNILL